MAPMKETKVPGVMVSSIEGWVASQTRAETPMAAISSSDPLLAAPAAVIFRLLWRR